MSQGQWPDEQEQPSEGLAFAEEADFQALAYGGAAEMCSWRPWPAFHGDWTSPELYPGAVHCVHICVHAYVCVFHSWCVLRALCAIDGCHLQSSP